MEIKVNVTIEGLDDLTQAIGILANAIAMGRATTTEYINAGPDRIKVVEKLDKEAKASKEDKRVYDPEYKCGACGGPVYQTDSGYTCDQGHGGMEIHYLEDDVTTDGPEDPDAEPDITMEDLRAELVKVGKNISKEASKKILTALGVDKLQDMDPGDYAKAMQMAKAALKKAGK